MQLTIQTTFTNKNRATLVHHLIPQYKKQKNHWGSSYTCNAVFVSKKKERPLMMELFHLWISMCNKLYWVASNHPIWLMQRLKWVNGEAFLPSLKKMIIFRYPYLWHPSRGLFWGTQICVYASWDPCLLSIEHFWLFINQSDGML